MTGKKLVTLTLVMVFVLGLAGVVMAVDPAVTETEYEKEYLAAPAVAGELLEEAGIDNRYGTGRDGGNFIRDVAHKMNEDDGTDFNGIPKTDVEAYEDEVAMFLCSLGAEVDCPGCGVLDPEASGATATDNADGTVTLEITVVDLCGKPISGLDPLSEFSVTDFVIDGTFYFGTGSIPGSTAWSEEDGVYTVTLERNFFNARPAGYNDGWYRIWNIYVEGEMVEEGLELSTTYWAVGNWKMDLYVGDNLNERFVIIDSHVEGENGVLGFFGEGYDPEEDYWGTITGTIDGQSISMLYERTDIDTDYTAEFEGTIADDGNSMSGTWSDYARTNETWDMFRQ